MLKRESESESEKTSDTRKIKSEIERVFCSIEIDEETAEIREKSEVNTDIRKSKRIVREIEKAE